MSVMNHTASVPAAEYPWLKAALITGLALLAVFVLYWPTFYSMVEIWERSETFTHGFLIFPISAWLIWGRRHHLARIEPVPDWRGCLLFGISSLVWLLADAGSVNVVAQYAFVAMLIVTVWAILGMQIVWSIFFPLMFLFFAVPVGEFLIFPLMNFTADFTVAALQMTGIPVFREGTFFSIPSGDWSVVEGCSGLRYLIASITLGCLYAYLTFRSWKRRLIFTLASLIVPIFANGMRAYMIVMIAHLSDMKLALGVDHFVYGWVWFGVVMLLLFWIGSFWREDADPAESSGINTGNDVRAPRLSNRLLPIAMVVLMMSMMPPLYSSWLNRSESPKDVLIQVSAKDGWQLDEGEFTDWLPRWQGSDQQFRGNYLKNVDRVFLEVNFYRSQRQDRELINSQNVFIPQKHPVWSNVGETKRHINIHGREYSVKQAKLRSDRQRLLAWQWDVVDGHMITNEYEAKIRLAMGKVLGRGDEGMSVIIATPYKDDLESAERTLSDFLVSVQPVIRQK